MTKQAPGRLLAYVADRSSGAPVAGAALSVLAQQQPAGTMQSDADGIASINLSLAHPENIVVLAHRGDDWAVESPMGFNFGEERANPWRAYIYTDRPVYRPGHPVHFKAMFRKQDGLAYAVPGGTVDFEVQDAEGTAVFEQKGVAISPYGGAWGSFTLKVDAALGYYTVIARAPHVEQMSGGFQVEEYKKPEYEVRVTPEKARVFEGDPIRATIDARYYFGEPVAKGKVKWVVHRTPYYSPVFWRDEGEPDEGNLRGGGDNDNGEGGEQLSEQQGTLGADGKMTISFPSTQGDTDYMYSIEARVTDEGNREITGSSQAVAVRGNFLLNIEPDRYGYQPGQQARFHIQARDYDGKPVATAVHLELIDRHWNEPKKDKTLLTADGSTDASGEGTLSATIPAPSTGTLIARITAKTPVGRVVDADAYLWVQTGTQEGSERGQDLQLLPDRKTYQPGDTAKLLVVSQTRIEHALITVEGRNISSPRVLHPSAKSFTVEVLVTPELSPNFFVAVTALVGGNLHQGMKSIAVPALDKQLKVAIVPAKTQYKPGETARYTISAHDTADRPVAVEFSFGVVDEAIYAIQRDQTRDPAGFFYARLYNEVQTESSLAYYFTGAAGTRRLQLTRLRPPSALAQLKPERLLQPKVRKAFPDTAFWVPNVITGANGTASVSFDFPDTLTTWRATARGLTKDTKGGGAVMKTVVRKNLLVRLAAPRFFTEGDEVTIGVIVHNYLKDTKTARVSLESTGVDVLSGSSQDVTISSQSDAKVEWRIRPKDAASVNLTAKALTDEESDAVELVLPVIPQGVKQAESRSGVLSADAAAFQLSYPAGAAAQGRRITLQFTPSVAGSLFRALEYLTSFPYGCTEQTMSSFLPNLVVADALRKLNVKTGIDPADLNAKVRAGLARLLDYQHPDGGWGWWPTDDSSVFMTAYVVAGLHQATELGHKLPNAQMVNLAAKWLQGALAKDTKMDPDLRAYAVFAMRGEAGPVWDLRADLSPYGLALLGLTLDTKRDARAGEIAAALESKAESDANTAHWTLNRDTLMGFYGDTSPEATAYAMKFLIRSKPESPLIPKAARWLVAHRNEGSWWYSTKQTAMVIYGLTDYLKQSGELNADFHATVSVDGQLLLDKHFTAADAMAAVPEEVTLQDAASATPNIRITRQGAGRLYWSVRQEYYSTDRKLVDTGDLKLNLIREYFRMVQGKKDGRIVYDVEPLHGALATGDLLGVRLTVTGTEIQYALTEDPIPSGAEFVTRDDLYELRNPGNWWTRYLSRREFRDDRAAFFNRYQRAGQTQYFYLLKITNAGRFKISPARVYPMYQPERIATTAPAEVTVQ